MKCLPLLGIVCLSAGVLFLSDSSVKGETAAPVHLTAWAYPVHAPPVVGYGYGYATYRYPYNPRRAYRQAVRYGVAPVAPVWPLTPTTVYGYPAHPLYGPIQSQMPEPATPEMTPQPAPSPDLVEPSPEPIPAPPSAPGGQ